MLLASYVMGRWLRGSGWVRSWSMTCLRVSLWVFPNQYRAVVARRTSLMTVWRFLGTCLFLSGSLAFCCSFRRCWYTSKLVNMALCDSRIFMMPASISGFVCVCLCVYVGVKAGGI